MRGPSILFASPNISLDFFFLNNFLSFFISTPEELKELSETFSNFTFKLAGFVWSLDTSSGHSGLRRSNLLTFYLLFHTLK